MRVFGLPGWQYGLATRRLSRSRTIASNWLTWICERMIDSARPKSSSVFDAPRRLHTLELARSSPRVGW
jgi:hypothetical protein